MAATAGEPPDQPHPRMDSQKPFVIGTTGIFVVTASRGTPQSCKKTCLHVRKHVDMFSSKR